MFIVFHMILQEHMIKALNDFLVKSPTRQVTILQSLMTIGTVVVNLQWFLSCDLARPHNQRVM